MSLRTAAAAAGLHNGSRSGAGGFASAGGKAGLGKQHPQAEHKPRTCKVPGCPHATTCKGRGGKKHCLAYVLADPKQKTLSASFMKTKK